MIKTSCGYMTPLEYKMINDIDNNIDNEKKVKSRKKQKNESKKCSD